MYLQRQKERGQPIGDAAVAQIVWMESVGAQHLFLHLQLGLDTGGGKQIQHRQRIEPRHLFDDVHVIHQAASVVVGNILVCAVNGCQKYDGGRGILLNQAVST